jgi:deoxyribodipyrimidine photo-lyase
MLEGLCKTAKALRERGIGFSLRIAPPVETVLAGARRAAMVVTDRGYLAHQRTWRDELAKRLDCLMVEIEADVVVPLAVTSDKAEYAARTIRPKIHKHLERFLVESSAIRPRCRAEGVEPDSEPIDDWRDLLDRLGVESGPEPVTHLYTGGTDSARGRLGAFIRHKLDDYDAKRSDPSLDIQSHLSAYLHFGQIGVVEVALAVAGSGASAADRDAFLEELIVRRELGINFVWYTPEYASYRALPGWARASLEAHKADKREFIYTAEQLEAAQTHDPYWNAAMREMKLTGKMHNYMRMYWGKKILEWTNTPRFAHRLALELNNRYFLDGRDPLSWSNVGWLFGLHDRPWRERDIFGQIRYMNASGLERKFDIVRYVERIESLEPGPAGQA